MLKNIIILENPSIYLGRPRVRLEFRVRVKSALDLKLLSKIGDPVGYDLAHNLHIYRLNPSKAASMSRGELEDILERYGVRLPRETLDYIEGLRGADVTFSLEGSDLKILTTNREYVEKAKKRKLIVEYKGEYRAKPSNLQELIEEAERLGLKWKTTFNLDHKLTLKLNPTYKLREYQREAYEKWKEKKRGVIVLPVAAGKTLIGVHAINDLKLKTLIIVPTLDLQNQWVEKLETLLGIDRNKIGVYGGGRKEHKQITVITYDSAHQTVETYATRYGLIIADECHHAVSPNYRRALLNTTAPYRLGLTATPQRSDALHKLYPQVIGPIIYRLSPKTLQEKGYLAEYTVERVYVKLSPQEYKRYKELMKRYLDYCKKNIPQARDAKERFKKTLEQAAKSREAREALRARHEAKKIALNAERKIEKLEEILEKLKDHKIIIFSRYADVVREISKRLLIPKILHDTPKNERHQYLKMFREGKVRIIASAMALDEGVDVPDASAAIIISGTSSHREYVQRLGRILRPKEDRAVLIELITERTLEPSMARRRRKPHIFEDRTGRTP